MEQQCQQPITNPKSLLCYLNVWLHQRSLRSILVTQLMVGVLAPAVVVWVVQILTTRLTQQQQAARQRRQQAAMERLSSGSYSTLTASSRSTSSGSKVLDPIDVHAVAAAYRGSTDGRASDVSRGTISEDSSATDKAANLPATDGDDAQKQQVVSVCGSVQASAPASSDADMMRSDDSAFVRRGRPRRRSQLSGESSQHALLAQGKLETQRSVPSSAALSAIDLMKPHQLYDSSRDSGSNRTASLPSAYSSHSQGTASRSVQPSDSMGPQPVYDPTVYLWTDQTNVQPANQQPPAANTVGISRSRSSGSSTPRVSRPQRLHSTWVNDTMACLAAADASSWYTDHHRNRQGPQQMLAWLEQQPHVPAYVRDALHRVAVSNRVGSVAEAHAKGHSALYKGICEVQPISIKVGAGAGCVVVCQHACAGTRQPGLMMTIYAISL